jgi:cytochrome c-type protein NapB
MKTTLKISLAAVLAVASCWSAAQHVSSMRGSEVPAIDKAPIEQPYLGSKPGGQKLIVRTFLEQPPLIPHKVEGLDDINATDNTCLDCHINDVFRGQKVPRAGVSHFLPTSTAAKPEFDMKRWQCNSCHVPQVDAKPLVENVFKGNVAP